MKKFMVVFLMLVLAAGAFAEEGVGEGGGKKEKVDTGAYDLYNEGYDKYLGKDYIGALKDFKKALKMKPDFIKAYNKAGLANVAMNKPDHAIFMYKKAVNIEPQAAECWFNMAIAYEHKNMLKKKKDTSKAEKYYEEAIMLNNDNYVFVRASLNLAKIYRKQEHFDDAVLLLRKAMKIEPDFADLYNEAGLVYYDTAIYKKAVEFFLKAERLPC